MKIIKDIREFRLRTGLLIDLEFEPIDLVPNGLTGVFNQNRLPELVDFCRENPVYHIISFIRPSPIRVNAPIQKAVFYMLGNGDNDPELMCVPSRSEKAIADLRDLEFDID